jgi:hypothetical protein
MFIGRFCLLLVALGAIAAPFSAFGITLGQIDTFEANPTANWGGGLKVENLSGGPAGASDHFLSLILAPPGGSGTTDYLLLIGNVSQ